MSDFSCIIEPLDGRGGLFQSDIHSAANHQLLQAFNINHVLTCCIEASLQFPPHVHNLVLNCHDTPDFDMRVIFPQACDYLDASRMSSNVLVHCHAGISRSSCLVIAYLMKKRKLTAEEALRYVKSIRPIVRPNPGFLKQLLLYEEELFGVIKSVLTNSLTPYYGIQSTLARPISQSPLTSSHKKSYTQLKQSSPNPQTQSPQYQPQISPVKQVQNQYTQYPQAQQSQNYAYQMYYNQNQHVQSSPALVPNYNLDPIYQQQQYVQSPYTQSPQAYTQSPQTYVQQPSQLISSPQQFVQRQSVYSQIPNQIQSYNQPQQQIQQYAMMNQSQAQAFVTPTKRMPSTQRLQGTGSAAKFEEDDNSQAFPVPVSREIQVAIKKLT